MIYSRGLDRLENSCIIQICRSGSSFEVRAREGGEPARLRAAIRGLVRRFGVSERADVSCCGVTVAQAAALEALFGHGPMRLSDLGRRLGIAPSTLTRNLDRLDRGRPGRAPGRRAGRAGGPREADGGRAGARRSAWRTARRTSRGRCWSGSPRARRAAVVESLADLLAAVRGATEACCPGAFDHLMEGFAAANACGPGDCELRHHDEGRPGGGVTMGALGLEERSR